MADINGKPKQTNPIPITCKKVNFSSFKIQAIIDPKATSNTKYKFQACAYDTNFVRPLAQQILPIKLRNAPEKNNLNRNVEIKSNKVLALSLMNDKPIK